MSFTQVVEMIWVAVGLYVLLGSLFALAFVSKGVTRVDPTAKGSGWGFRVLIFPGAVAFWPMLLKRWMGGATQPPSECNPHRCKACVAKEAGGDSE